MAPFAKTYRNVHYKEDGTTLFDPIPVSAVVLPVQFGSPTTSPGQLSYALGGDAVEGVHFEVGSGSDSPLEVPTGATAASISVDLDPLDQKGTLWFKEKLCSVSLTGGTSVDVDPSAEFRLWIRSTAPVPQVAFQTATGTGNSNSNANDIIISQSTVSGEETRIFYTLAGDAVAGVDYTIAPGCESGTLSIPAGQTSTVLSLNVLPSADGSGKQVTLALDHEASDRSDENMWVNTHAWSLDESDLNYAGDPSAHSTGAGELSSLAPSGTLGLDVISQAASVPKTAPDGHVLEGAVQSQYMEQDCWYLRPSFENQYFCAGPVTLHPLPAYTRVSVYVETFLPPDDWRNSIFVNMIIRNRMQDIDHKVVFRRGDTAEEVSADWAGNTAWGTPVSTPTGYWGLWNTANLEGNSWDVDFGVVEDVVDGQNLTRLWLNHFANETTTFTSGSGNPVTENLGSDLTTAIFRFTHFSDQDGSSNLTGGDVGNRGKGLLAYWPKLEMSATTLSGPPLRFWEKRGRFWEPRGNACIDLSAQNDHTFTIL